MSRDANGILTKGTMVKFKNGDPVPIVEVKKVFVGHGFYEPEYTVKLKDGRLYKSNEGEFTVVNSSPRSTNPVIANALNSLEARNDAYTDFKEFKFFKTCALHEISNAKTDIERCAKTLESDFKQSLTRTTKESEKDYITTCYEKCKAALKEAYDRLRKQEANVMA